MKKSCILKYFLIFTVLFIVACDEFELVHDLNERDANEIIVLLAKNNIRAQKLKEVRQQDVYWTILVDEGDEIEAQSILVANHLPRVKHGGLAGICDEPGMIVTEKFEKCQEILALKGEIINALETVPGVVSADVVLNIPDKEEFPDEDTPMARPTAAVTLRYLSDANVKTNLSEGKIQEFVANTVNGLDPRDVKVILSFLEQKIDKIIPVVATTKNGSNPTAVTNGGETITTATDSQNLVSVGGIMMDEDSANKFKIIAAVFLVLLLLLAGAFIFALLRMAKMRKRSAVPAEAAGDKDEGDKKLLEA